MVDNSEISILVVDDTPGNLKILSGMLQAWGFRVQAAKSGELALKLALNQPPHMVLLDIDMPDMNGYEVCSRMKQSHALKEVPVIFISALTETMDKVRAFSCGGIDYITKPFQPDEVRVRVSTHLKIQDQKRQLNENYKKLKKMENLRDNLVHMIAHDMRSPLTCIVSSLQLFEMQVGNKINSSEKEDLARAIQSSIKLNEMISSMLDLSRMENNEMPVKISDFRIDDIIEQAIDSMMIPRQRLNLQYKLQSRPFQVVCDHELTRRVIINLLSNARKHSSEDQSITIDTIMGADGNIVLCVRDSGPGIPEEFHQHIFTKFGQIETRPRNSAYSTGLGLAFCKMAVEIQGGQIGVESRINEGSTFWFTLPAAEKMMNHESLR
ncbi:MAG: hypothetical protein CVV64_14105 [Candidatus Wallbacteria bacterium HGW-Wallbacteria-1]|uniref:histidine kinase n=1 Tax=Candidatus Wallbacteria bacterium HGW-Wallbacteria-1 TaxID=2013854 RepID=A0A2N1PMI3_9BACT|nr:MAG: hypothetical protein CVV64_14105 [Candidatus Wallbacteria bacterium HGW-Wallbacteria-1]